MKDYGRFPFAKHSENLYWVFPFGKRAFHLSQVPFEAAEGRLKDRERSGTDGKDEKSREICKWNTNNIHWEVSTGKMGLPFQKFRLFRKSSSGTNHKVVFHLHPNQAR